MPENNSQKNNQQINSPKPFKGVIWIFLAFFSTFIIVDIFYITMAEKTWRGLATEDGYQKGLKYNETLKAVKTQKNLGWKLDIKYTPTSAKQGGLQVKLFDKDNQEIRDAKLSVKVKRPVEEGHDFSIDLKFNPETSSYNSKATFPLIGQWELETIAVKNSDIFQEVKRIVVR